MFDMIKIGQFSSFSPLTQTHDGMWYVSNREGNAYLHSTGRWLSSTRSRSGEWTGYYPTKEDALATVARYFPDAVRVR